MSDCSGYTKLIEEGKNQITSENYVENAMHTDCVYDMALHARLVSCSRLLHAAIGIATEAGEFLDALKKHIYYGKSLDIVNCKEEASDLYWYLGLAIDDMRTTMNDVLKLNIDKLRLRYPNKFSGEAAINRDVEAERVLLERVEIQEEDKALLESLSPEKSPGLYHQHYAGRFDNEELKEKYISQVDRECGPLSERGKDFVEFAYAVLHHIENYTVPQYGDKGEDQASEWSIEQLLEQAKKYINRYGKNQREGQQELDFLKACHYVQLAHNKYQEENQK